MKLLFVSNLFPPYHLGGYEQLCCDIATRLSARGHDISVLTSTFGINQEGSESGVHRRLRLESDVYHYHMSNVLKYRSIRAHNRRVVEETLKLLEPEAVVIWSMWKMSREVPRQLEKRMGSRVVYYLASAWPVEPSAHEEYWESPANSAAGTWLRRVLRGPVKALLRAEWRPVGLMYRHVMSCSQSVCDQLAAQKVAVGNMRVVYHGIDPAPYTEAARRGRNQELDQLRVLFVGSLLRHKGVHTAINAIASVRRIDETLPVTLDILGRGHPEYETQLLAMVDRLRLRDRVTFHEPIPRSQLPGFMAGFNALVLPSIWEEPMALISEEAMAAQMVLVGAWTGGTKELLIDGVNGLAFPAEDVDALARHLVCLARSRDLRTQLALAGWRTVTQQFTMAHTLDAFEDCLNEVVSSS
jgi:glycogen(starch) synthase